MEAVRELDRVLGVTRALDGAIGQVKQRDRGLSPGQVVTSMASAQLGGEDFMVGLDRRRQDTAGQVLEPVPTPASTTWAGNAKRFTGEHLARLPVAMKTISTRWVSRLPAARRGALLRQVTIDENATDVEVYGRTKQGAAHAYTGALTLHAHIGHWVEAGVPLAAELMGGTDDPRSNMVEILDAAIGALPDGIGRISCRWDAGYFAADLAKACIARGVSSPPELCADGPHQRMSQNLLEQLAAVIAHCPHSTGSWPVFFRCTGRNSQHGETMHEHFAGLPLQSLLFVIFGTDVPAEPAPGARGVLIRDDDPLADEAFLIVLSDHAPVALFARTCPDGLLDVALTHDPELVHSITRRLIRCIPARTTPRSPPARTWRRTSTTRTSHWRTGRTEHGWDTGDGTSRPP